MYGNSFKFYFWTPCGSKYGFVCLKFNGELLGKHLDRSKKTQIACRLQDVFFFQLKGSCFFIICGDVDEFEIRNIYHSDWHGWVQKVCVGRRQNGVVRSEEQQVIHQTLSWTIMWMGRVGRRRRILLSTLSTKAWKFQFDLKFALYKVHCLHLMIIKYTFYTLYVILSQSCRFLGSSCLT